MTNPGPEKHRLQTDMRLRVLQRHGTRVSIRLEEAFWRQLEAAAREQNVKLGALVFNVLDTAGDGDNRTSRLRTYCVLWLRQQLLRARLAAQDANLPIVLAACPTPCFVIGPTRNLAGYNPAYARRFLPHATTEEVHGAQEDTRFTFRQPFNQIRRAMADQPDRVYFERIGITCAGNQETSRVSLCLMTRKQGAESPVLAFLMADEAQA